MKQSNIILDRVFFLDVAIEQGAESALGLLLLIGPDAFLGTYGMYKDLEATLEAAAIGN